MKPIKGSTAPGFSLVELLVAMTVTMIVSGAIYGLLAKGNNAFRREPEMAARQQSIRVAMDLIMRDIGNAGVGMHSSAQIFTRSLDACTSCPNGGAPLGPDGASTDELEIISNADRPGEPVCNNSSSAPEVTLVRGTVSLSLPRPVLIIFTDGSWTIRNVVSTSTTSAGVGTCVASSPHTRLNFNSGAGDTFGMNPPGGLCQPSAQGMGNAGPPNSCDVAQVGFGEVVRYRIRNEADGVPVLERFSSVNATPTFQSIARGIEDLQVDYVQANGMVSTNGAPLVNGANFNTLVTGVVVRLSARGEGVNLEGMTTAASARSALRGRLASTGTPRAALVWLSQASPAPLWR